MENIITSKNISTEIYLSHIRSLLNPYRNMKPHINIFEKKYKPSKLSICYSCKDISNLQLEESKKYYLIYYDENYLKYF